MQSGFYVVAPFQRASRWKQSMALRPLLDCYDQFESDETEPFYLGSVVTYQEGLSSNTLRTRDARGKKRAVEGVGV